MNMRNIYSGEKPMASLQDVQLNINKQVRETWPDKGLEELRCMCTLGLAEEAGEVAGLMKRKLRSNSRDTGRATQSEFKEELGDVLWYLTACCMLNGFDLDDIWEENKRKLTERYGKKL